MKKILFINSVVDYGSTGKICSSLAQEYEKEGYEAWIAYGRGNSKRKNTYRIGGKINNYFHAIISRLFDNHGRSSVFATYRFVRWAEKLNPSVVWLHNLHGYYINYKILFEWLKRHPEMEIKWTLHDCWAFTGHCAYFTYAGCRQWETMCKHCCQKRDYPASLFVDNCNNNYLSKKAAFCRIKNMTIITPSEWLATLVKKSFLAEYPVTVIANEIDKEIFRPRKSDFKERNQLMGKIIVLGVANAWTARKGYSDIIKIADRLDDRFQVILVGLTETQIKALPSNIIGIMRTENQIELAEIYSAADIYINPSREETYGLTNAEALSCGTMAVVYKDTACEEVALSLGGIAVEQNADAMYRAIIEYFADK